jgi:hypothetical protein
MGPNLVAARASPYRQGNSAQGGLSTWRQAATLCQPLRAGKRQPSRPTLAVSSQGAQRGSQSSSAGGAAACHDRGF